MLNGTVFLVIIFLDLIFVI